MFFQNPDCIFDSDGSILFLSFLIHVLERNADMAGQSFEYLHVIVCKSSSLNFQAIPRLFPLTSTSKSVKCSTAFLYFVESYEVGDVGDVATLT